MEKIILETFKEYMKGEVDDLEVFVSFEESNIDPKSDKTFAFIMEIRTGGLVWECELDEQGQVIDVIEID